MLLARGGIGGGNAFKSSTMQPRFAQPGMPGEELRNIEFEACGCWVCGASQRREIDAAGENNNAKPKIADYPFTTLIPNLGVVQRDDGTSYKIADIPGIIEGAHRGLGLGLSFLRHIERVRVILYLIDVTLGDPSYNLELLRSELKTYNDTMMDKPYFILLTKADLCGEEEAAKKAELFGDDAVLPVSSESGYNIERLVGILDQLLGYERVP